MNEEVKYCFYCKDPIEEGEGCIRVGGVYYHYDPLVWENNCYFPDDVEDDE